MASFDFAKGGPAFPFEIGDNSQYYVSRVVFQVKGAGTFSFTPQIKVRHSDGFLVAADLTNVSYTNRASVAPVAAGTAITVAGIYEVDGAGVEVWLSGSYTSGACQLVIAPVIG